jgi:hypothetical protein
LVLFADRTIDPCNFLQVKGKLIPYNIRLGGQMLAAKEAYPVLHRPTALHLTMRWRADLLISNNRFVEDNGQLLGVPIG